MLNVALLWHMHQPNYVNSVTGVAMLPWVRLHCVKGYMDMIELARKYPALRLNFNITPILLFQILNYSEKRITDFWEILSRKSPADLLCDEKVMLLENFFKIHTENHILPYPRYRQLLEMRGKDSSIASLRERAPHFSDQDFLDLQVWYNLSWCGFTAHRRYPELTELKRKGAGFTDQEKQHLLDIHAEIVALIPKLYKEAQDEGLIEITTTPFFHPIMPLIYDTDIAKRCMPGRVLPQRFSAPEDVQAHLRLAQEQHERVFGKKARGLWPSEGSVCPEILPFLKEAGIEYFCSDEEILFRTLKEDPNWKGKKVDHLELFQGWNCAYDGVELMALFRERPLSDYIGFQAARSRPHEAADYLSHHLEHIAGLVHLSQNIICLALDGENAWETFPDGGEAFLTLFYQKILSSSKLKTVLLADYVGQKHELPRLTTLHSGSWINADFDIWIGDSEENQAWEFIAKTRAFLLSEEKTGKIKEAVLQKAWREIYAAEGSDWFWWYGPDFQISGDFIFDELFRTHLKNIYYLLGIDSPHYLDVPICHDGHTESFTRPVDFISPTLNGEGGGYLDWMGAGRINLEKQGTAMFQSDRIAHRILYGLNPETFFFRVDAFGRLPDKIILLFQQPYMMRVVVDPIHGTGVLEKSEDNVHFKHVAPVNVFCKRSMEWAVPLDQLGWKLDGTTVTFMVQIFEKGVEKEHYPQHGLFEFVTPSSRLRLQNWFI